jgi:hypothetical protein
LEAVAPEKRPHLQVFLDGEAKKGIVGLGNIGEAQVYDFVGFHTGYLASLEAYSPPVSSRQPEDGLEQRGLTRAVGADDGYDLPWLDMNGDSVEDLYISVARYYLLDFKKAHQTGLPR